MAAGQDGADPAELWYEHKSRLVEKILGKEHNMVMHAVIPYEPGGARLIEALKSRGYYPYSEMDRDPVA
ncbi:MAG: hypothetical protein N3A38_13990 [Planctomycetota bacterium]|nr:hypothetical protein [Planctomycetota bacterium]